ncbi:MFS transporter [Paraburkholderia sp. ZP32-5]|uniref:MFS transporter n=1 Tax=Paraburkholderia sp. ZP32-5 TaxID=2883245 RepID=UPI001F46FF10|nr:MFS transporter [Paraburkholderia sp. ZP32-5]
MNTTHSARGDTAQVDSLEAATIRRVSIRFLPLLVIAFLITYLDRVNVGFAALTANRDLGMTPQSFAFGAGIFFLGYFVCEVPSNLALERFGARLWLGRILITIGIVSAATSLVTSAQGFYAVRFLLGAAEAGLFPGVIYFMTRWFPRRYRASMMALFMLAIPLSSFIGAPISGAILELDGMAGLHGWQWLYLLEGLPSVLVGVVCMFWLTDSPAQASWLSDGQREWLVAELASERAPVRHHGSRWRLAFNPTLLAYAAIFFGVTAGTYGLSLWLPLILKTPGLSTIETGLLVAIPFGFGCIATVLWSRSSDRRRERVWHTALPAFVSALGLGACIMLHSVGAQIVALSLASLGLYGVKGPFFAMVTERIAQADAAPGIAIITSLAGLAGFVGPYAIGWIKMHTGSYSQGLLFLAFLCLLSGVIAVAQSRRKVD